MMKTLLNGKVYLPKRAEKCGLGKSKENEFVLTSDEDVKEPPKIDYKVGQTVPFRKSKSTEPDG